VNRLFTFLNSRAEADGINMQKYLVITGGSRGIGLATIRRFQAQQYQVVNISRTRPAQADVDHINADLSDIRWPLAVQDELQHLLRRADQICLVHNAGRLIQDSVANVDAGQFQQIMQLNVIAASQLNQLLLPLMKPGSAILYVSSTLGEKAVANSCSYVSSKHAQVGLMKATCQDLMGQGIHTAAICPGFTDTEMLRQHANNDVALLQHFADISSFKRLLKPEEIADTVYFCAQSPAINGAVMHANLGQLEN
jgi:3-oxoacyl-[acyl-carrier protein] reductase